MLKFKLITKNKEVHEAFVTKPDFHKTIDNRNYV